MNIANPESPLSELPSLPIPDSLIPDGIHFVRGDFGLAVGFDRSFDPNALLSSEHPELWASYTGKIATFLKQKYPEHFRTQPPERFAQLVEGFSRHLSGSWAFLHFLMREQGNFGQKGDLESMDEFNKPGAILSFPKEFQRLSLKHFLISELHEALPKLHPYFKKISPTEEKLATDVVVSSSSPDTVAIKFTPEDQETLKNMGINVLIERDIKDRLEEAKESEVVDLYFSPDKRLAYVAQTDLGRIIPNFRET